MTCNPFTSAAAKNSVSIIRPENLDILDFQEILDFEQNLAKRFCKENLSSLTRNLNNILRETDLRNHAVLNEKLEQSPINSEELAEFLLQNSQAPDTANSIITEELNRRAAVTGVQSVRRNTIRSVSLVDYPRNNPPGIYKKVASYLKNKPQNLKASFKGTIDEQGKITGTLYDTNSVTLGDCVPVSGSGFGIEGIQGNFKITGVVDGETLQGSIKGGTYTPGFIVCEANLQATDENSGSNASFNVVIGSNGLPLITIANAGSNYNTGDVIILDELGISISVDNTSDLVLSPSSGGAISTVTNPSEIVNKIDPNIIDGTIPTLTNLSTTPVIPISKFDTVNYPSGDVTPFTPSQDFIDLVNSLDIFLNDNYGPSISSGACGSSFLGLISGLFDLFRSLQSFQIQLPNLSEIWNNITDFKISVPSLLSTLQKTFTKIIDNLMAKARQTINNVKNAVSNIGKSINVLSKEIIDLERFYSQENQLKIKNLASSIMQKMYEQFDRPAIDIISWILTRLCQLSSFISNFLQNPINSISNLIDQNNIVKNGLLNLTNSSIAGVTSAGALRLSRKQLVDQAAAAASRSNSSGKSGRTPNNRTPSRITAFPISDEDNARVIYRVKETGWSGYFTFASSVINNNYGPAWGERFDGAGWKVIVRDNPILFAKIQKIIQELGDGPYIINSAFRSEEYNSTIPGAARRSAHTEALALDIKMTASQAIDFVPLASANGFNGIAYYPSKGFLHVDLRSYRQSPGDRSWNTGGGLSAELRNVINNHQNKLYNR